MFPEDVRFTTIDNNFITMEENPDNSTVKSTKTTYIVDFEKNLFQVKTIYLLTTIDPDDKVEIYYDFEEGMQKVNIKVLDRVLH